MLFIIKLLVIINIIMNLISFQQPVDYYKEQIKINNRNQQVHTLVVDMDNKKLSIVNALSFGKIYGFEETSKMVKKNKAIAGVNGMFYSTYGHHIGLLVSNKQLITKAYSKTPIFAILDDNTPYIGDVNTEVSILASNNIIEVGVMNDEAPEETWVLYKSIYGNTTRITRKSINYIIEDNNVINKIVSEEPVDIPENGYVISRVTNEPDKYNILDIGDNVNIEIKYIPDIGVIKEAFQSGGWLVKNGHNIAKDNEVFIGNTNIPNPRTIIGITYDNKVIIKVIDGRQLGYSYGISGKEAGDIMIEEKCKEAIYLDGGASSTMVFEGKVVNSPSNKVERKVAHSILIK